MDNFKKIKIIDNKNISIFNKYSVSKNIFFKLKYFIILILFCFIFIFNYIEPKISQKIVNNKNNNYTMFPKISIFLPIYNKAKYLNRSIGSVQKQTLKEIEIIAVNDNSTDNTLEVLINISKNDSRIKIINNDKNRGLLYSRAMGIINSKGEYLMNIDPDDELKGPDNLEYIYNKAKESNIDIVSFVFLKNNHINLKCSNINNIILQPNIFYSANKFEDYLIWNKLVKKELFLKAYEIFKPKIYGEKWNYGEDEIWSVLVNKYAQSMICINKPIYIYNTDKNSLMTKKSYNLYLKNLIYWHEMLKQILNDQQTQIFLNKRSSIIIKVIRSNLNFVREIINDKNLINYYINFFN